MKGKIYFKFVNALVLILVLLAAGCDEGSVRSLGAKVGLRGQDVGNSAVTALEKISKYEAVDYSQRQRMQILVLPPEILASPPSKLAPLLKVDHYRLDAVQMQNRINLYDQLSTAYLALQKLSEGEFGKDSQEAATAFNTSLSKIKSIPQIPPSVSSVLPGLTSFIVDKKQADYVRKINLKLYILVEAHRKLWEADRPTWTAYLHRCRDAYINNLRSIPNERFDLDKLKKEVNQPFKDQYIVQMYKNQEEERVNAEIGEIEDYFDRVDGAFLQLEKAHIELAKQKPSYLDAISELDSIVSVIEPILEKK